MQNNMNLCITKPWSFREFPSEVDYDEAYEIMNDTRKQINLNF